MVSMVSMVYVLAMCWLHPTHLWQMGTPVLPRHPTPPGWPGGRGSSSYQHLPEGCTCNWKHGETVKQQGNGPKNQYKSI